MSTQWKSGQMEKEQQETKRSEGALRQRRHKLLKKSRVTLDSDDNDEDTSALLSKSCQPEAQTPCTFEENVEKSENSDRTMSPGSDSGTNVPKNRTRNSCSQSAANVNESQVQSMSLSVDDVKDIPSARSSSCDSKYPSDVLSDPSDEEKEHDDKTDSNSFADQLRYWTLKNKTRHTVITELFQILQPRFPELLKIAKILLQSNSCPQYTVEKFIPWDDSEKSEFVHFGTEEHLKKPVTPKLH
ncbi:hypothetical protein QAD02_003674 [Eretmocerus hayati]|uniref:Uncharacterized protein n=1 Tax=Eretmocerus hayati TaxID=131215 RepID=A0ACC2NMD8_9HYME|nr:hypothetical protein QAD02_003674 [Eretmocerus hayati]